MSIQQITRGRGGDLRPRCVTIARAIQDLAVAGVCNDTNLAIAVAAGVPTRRGQSVDVSRTLRVLKAAELAQVTYNTLDRSRSIRIMVDDMPGVIQALLANGPN